MNRDLYQHLVGEFNRTLPCLGVDREEVISFAERELGPREDPADFMTGLAVLEEAIKAHPIKISPMEEGALAYSSLLHPNSPAHVIAGYGAGYPVIREVQEGAIEITDDPHPLHAYLKDQLNVDPYGVLGMRVDEPHHKDIIDPDTVKRDLLRLAELVANGGTSAPGLLHERYGMEHFGRYPGHMVLGQLQDISSAGADYEVPIYVARYDEEGALYGDYFYEQLLDTFAAAKGVRYKTVIYEVGSGLELLERMAEADSPAYGIVSAHGREVKICLNPADPDDDFTVDAALPKALMAEVRKTWKESGGLVLAVCETGAVSKALPKPCIAQHLANIAEVPVAASSAIVTDVGFRRRTRGLGRTSLKACFDSGSEESSGTNRIYYPPNYKPPADVKFRLSAE